MKKGKPFEAATHKVVKTLHPTHEVLRNVRVLGKLTQYPREVDVKLVDPNKYDFLAYECKDHKAPVDVELVESFVTKLYDLGAKKGAVVSNSGFTKSAERVAQAFNVDTLALVDTKDKSVRSKLYAGMIIEDIYIKYFSIGMSSSTLERFSIDPSHYTLMIRSPEGSQGTAYRIFASLWNMEETPLSTEPGSYVYQFTKEHGIEMLTLEGNWISLDEFHFSYEVRRRYYEGKIEMIDTCGLYDVRNKTYQTRSMATPKLNPTELTKEWPEISEEELEKRSKEFGMRLTVISALPEDYMGESD